MAVNSEGVLKTIMSGLFTVLVILGITWCIIKLVLEIKLMLNL